MDIAWLAVIAAVWIVSAEAWVRVRKLDAASKRAIAA